MSHLTTMTYAVTDRIARITLDRPARGNGIVPALPVELAACVERADLDPDVHVIVLSGNGKGFCGGYDLVDSAEGLGVGDGAAGDADEPGTAPGDASADGSATHTVDEAATPGSTADVPSTDPRPWPGPAPHRVPPEGAPSHPWTIAVNHNPSDTWDPMVDYAMMSRNVRGFMSLFHANKPVVCKVHGFCVAGGTDMALCSDLLVIAADAKIGYPPARVWGSPTTALWTQRLGAQRAKRLLFTGDSLSGAEALEWGLAIEAPAAEDLDERTEILLERIARVPVNQLMLHKLLINQELTNQGLHSTQVLGTVFDGITRHTREGYAFQQRAAETGFRQAVRERDEPFGDAGSSTFKG
ncbi:MAG: crotonase/enoyl-CoA hydratase family protein [Solirubrobacteraceae bacterium]